jgi:transporter family protein
VIAISYEPNPASKHAITKRSLIFSFLAFGFWGLWSLTSKMAIDRIGAGDIFAFYVISSLTAPLMYGWFRSVHPTSLKSENPTRNAWLLGGVGLALNVTGAFAYSFALGDGSASLVVPISSSYPLITIVLAVALLRERLAKFHLAALALIVVGLVMIGLTL